MKNRPTDIGAMNDDDLIFWALFTRDGIVAMRNADASRLHNEISEEEAVYEQMILEIKRRMKAYKELKFFKKYILNTSYGIQVREMKGGK